MNKSLQERTIAIEGELEVGDVQNFVDVADDIMMKCLAAGGKLDPKDKNPFSVHLRTRLIERMVQHMRTMYQLADYVGIDLCEEVEDALALREIEVKVPPTDRRG